MAHPDHPEWILWWHLADGNVVAVFEKMYGARIIRGRADDHAGYSDGW